MCSRPSYLINHLLTPQIYLLTLRLETAGYEVFKTSSININLHSDSLIFTLVSHKYFLLIILTLSAYLRLLLVKDCFYIVVLVLDLNTSSKTL